jgi:hypothetical protein
MTRRSERHPAGRRVVVRVIVTRQTTPRLAQDTIRAYIGKVDVAR